MTKLFKRPTLVRPWFSILLWFCIWFRIHSRFCRPEWHRITDATMAYVDPAWVEYWLKLRNQKRLEVAVEKAILEESPEVAADKVLEWARCICPAPPPRFDVVWTQDCGKELDPGGFEDPAACPSGLHRRRVPKCVLAPGCNGRFPIQFLRRKVKRTGWASHHWFVWG